MFNRYAKSWAAALGTLIATVGVALTGAEPEAIDGIAVAIGGGLATLFVLIGPANTDGT